MSQIEQELSTLMKVSGAMAAALVDYNSGMLLGSVGGGLDLEIAAGGNTEVIRSKIKTMKMLGINENIEDILITLNDHYHLIRPLETDKDLFIYYVLDKSNANLALSRRALKDLEHKFEVQ